MIRVNRLAVATLTAAFLLPVLLIAGTRVVQAEPATEEKAPKPASLPGSTDQSSPAPVDSTEENADLQQSAKNLRDIMSAMHVYHDVAGHLPAARYGWGYDAKTQEWFRQRPHLSWRVLLLPFLGEKELFAKFRLQEPWDSENNRQLIPLMPTIYRAPGSKAGDGKTNYLGVVGPDAAFPDKGTIMVQDFTDGTSGTIMLVEVPDEAAAEWTRPEDFPIETKQPVKKLVGLRTAGFLTAFADGAPQFISEGIAPRTLRLLLIRNDRQVPDQAELKRSVRFVPPSPVVRSKQQAENAEFRPRENARVRGKVTDEGGKPVVGAEIWLPLGIRGVGHTQTSHAQSDAQGRFALDIAPDWLVETQPWDRFMTVWAYATGHQLGTGKVTLPDGASDVVIQLGPATDTSFVVSDPEGRPCVGALVEPYYIRSWQAYQIPPDELLARVGTHTDNEGRAKLPAAPPDLLRQVRITTKDFGIQFQRTVEAPAIVGQVIRLRPTGRIEGRVIANQPEIVRGARLIFTSQENGDKPRPWPTTEWPTEGVADVTSDEQGRFIVPSIAVGEVRIDAHVDEKQPLRPKLPASLSVQADRTTTLEIPMVPTVVVRGSVHVTDTGKPVPGALVHIYYGVGRQGADPVSDSQGNYAARVLPGRIRLQVISMPTGYAWSRGNGSPFPEYEVPENAKEFDLPPVEALPTKTIPGRLIDEHGQPVAKAKISIRVGDRPFGYGETDSNGQFKLSGVPASVHPADVKYGWRPETGSTKPTECEVLETEQLVLRALPRDPRMDRP